MKTIWFYGCSLTAGDKLAGHMTDYGHIELAKALKKYIEYYYESLS